MTTLAIFALLVALLILGLPVAAAMGLTAVAALAVVGDASLLKIVAQRVYASTTAFPLLAIPFFILAGNLMNTGGMTERIFRFAHMLVGHMKGGLGQVNIVGSMVFAGMSGRRSPTRWARLDRSESDDPSAGTSRPFSGRRAPPRRRPSDP